MLLEMIPECQTLNSVFLFK